MNNMNIFNRENRKKSIILNSIFTQQEKNKKRLYIRETESLERLCKMPQADFRTSREIRGTCKSIEDRTKIAGGISKRAQGYHMSIALIPRYIRLRCPSGHELHLTSETASRPLFGNTLA